MVATDATPTYVSELEGSEVEALPAGAYVATLMKVESITTRFGEALKWHWLIARPAPDGGDFPLSGITSTFLSKNSNGNKIVKALRGSTLAPGEKLRVEQIEGRTALLLVVVDQESGYNKIREVSADRSERTTRPVEAVDSDEARAFAEWQASRAAVEA
jgi:hypothetical protein